MAMHKVTVAVAPRADHPGIWSGGKFWPNGETEADVDDDTLRALASRSGMLVYESGQRVTPDSLQQPDVPEGQVSPALQAAIGRQSGQGAPAGAQAAATPTATDKPPQPNAPLGDGADQDDSSQGFTAPPSSNAEGGGMVHRNPLGTPKGSSFSGKDKDADTKPDKASKK